MNAANFYHVYGFVGQSHTLQLTYGEILGIPLFEKIFFLLLKPEFLCMLTLGSEDQGRTYGGPRLTLFGVYQINPRLGYITTRSLIHHFVVKYVFTLF